MADSLAYMSVLTLLGICNFSVNFCLFVPNAFYFRKLSPNSLLSLTVSFGDLFLSSNTWLCLLVQSGVVDIQDKRICYINGILNLFGGPLLFMGIIGLALLRFLLVVMEKELSSAQVKSYCLFCICFCGFYCALPFILRDPDSAFVIQPLAWYCNMNWSPQNPILHGMLYASMFFISGPISMLGIMYWLIFRKLQQSTREIKQNMTSDSCPKSNDTSIESSTPNNPSEIQKLKNEESKLLVQSVAIVLIFLVGWIPYYVRAVVEMVTGKLVEPPVDFFTCMCIYLNGLGDSLIFLFFNGEMRGNVNRFFGSSK